MRFISGADKEVFSNLLIMLSPIAPHLAEELWQGLGNKESILKALAEIRPEIIG